MTCRMLANLMLTSSTQPSFNAMAATTRSVHSSHLHVAALDSWSQLNEPLCHGSALCFLSTNIKVRVDSVIA
jgi:hypothetical protein